MFVIMLKSYMLGGVLVDELTLLIKQEIKKQYRSVRQFAFSVGIAQTTVVSALKNGVSGTGFSTVMKICKALDIQVFDYSVPLVINDNVITLLKKYNALDKLAEHTVQTVLNVEYERCKADALKSTKH